MGMGIVTAAARGTGRPREGNAPAKTVIRRLMPVLLCVASALILALFAGATARASAMPGPVAASTALPPETSTATQTPLESATPVPAAAPANTPSATATATSTPAAADT